MTVSLCRRDCPVCEPLVNEHKSGEWGAAVPIPLAVWDMSERPSRLDASKPGPSAKQRTSNITQWVLRNTLASSSDSAAAACRATVGDPVLFTGMHGIGG